jgi:hypothetical protein
VNEVDKINEVNVRKIKDGSSSGGAKDGTEGHPVLRAAL